MTKEERTHEWREGWIAALQWAEHHLKKKAQSCFSDNEIYTGDVLEGCADALRGNYIDVVLKMLPPRQGDTG